MTKVAGDGWRFLRMMQTGKGDTAMSNEPMTARTAVRNYTTDPAVAQVATRADGWTLIVEDRATIVELCILQNRFNCDAFNLKDGRVELRPKDANTVAPTGADLIALLERGLDGTPHTLKVQAD